MVSRIPAERPAPAAARGNIRGTKRTCQNDACGARFYDLNRDPIECPVCGAAYVLQVSSEQVAGAAAETGLAGRGTDPSDALPVDEAVVADSEVEVDEADLGDEDVGLEIDDEADADDEIESVRGSGRGERPD